MVRVKWVGGPTGVKRLKANERAKPTEIGGELELSKAVISRMRGLGYHFESLDDAELPEPEPQAAPEGHGAPAQRHPDSGIEVVRH